MYKFAIKANQSEPPRQLLLIGLLWYSIASTRKIISFPYKTQKTVIIVIQKCIEKAEMIIIISLRAARKRRRGDGGAGEEKEENLP